MSDERAAGGADDGIPEEFGDALADYEGWKVLLESVEPARIAARYVYPQFDGLLLNYFLHEDQIEALLRRNAPAIFDSAVTTDSGDGSSPARYAQRIPLRAGGQGEVWLAQDTILDRPVALKIMKSRAADAPRWITAFVREYLITIKLRHPNIMPLHDAGRLNPSLPYYVMPAYCNRHFLRAIGAYFDRPREPAGLRLLEALRRFHNHPNSVNEQSLKVGSSRVDLQACKLEYSIVSPK